MWAEVGQEVLEVDARWRWRWLGMVCGVGLGLGFGLMVVRRDVEMGWGGVSRRDGSCNRRLHRQGHHAIDPAVGGQRGGRGGSGGRGYGEC